MIKRFNVMTISYYLASIFVAVLLVVILLSSCGPTSNLKKEITSMVEYPGTASGSELMLYVCGWPSTQKFELNSLKVYPSSTSSSKSGSANAVIELTKNSFKFKAEISFVYYGTYSGGHGFSQSSGMSFSYFKRENPVEVIKSFKVPDKILQLNDSISDCLNDSSIMLPDGNLCNIYSLKLEGSDPSVKFVLEADDKLSLTPLGTIYKDGYLIDPFSYFGQKLAAGNYLLLVTGGTIKGCYTLKIENMDEETRKNLK